MKRVVKHWNRLPSEITILNVFKRCVWSTWGHGLTVDMAVLSKQLDAVIVEVFSLMILYFYMCCPLRTPWE